MWKSSHRLTKIYQPGYTIHAHTTMSHQTNYVIPSKTMIHSQLSTHWAHVYCVPTFLNASWLHDVHSQQHHLLNYYICISVLAVAPVFTCISGKVPYYRVLYCAQVKYRTILCRIAPHHFCAMQPMDGVVTYLLTYESRPPSKHLHHLLSELHFGHENQLCQQISFH